jgi:hypothetical protein
MIALYILIGAIGIIILFFAYLWITQIIDERHERRYWSSRRKAFEYVHERLNDCRHWLNHEGHAPYRELFEFIMDAMKNNYGIKGDDIRQKVTEIIEKYKPLNP